MVHSYNPFKENYFISNEIKVKTQKNSANLQFIYHIYCTWHTSKSKKHSYIHIKCVINLYKYNIYIFFYDGNVEYSAYVNASVYNI